MDNLPALQTNLPSGNTGGIVARIQKALTVPGGMYIHNATDDQLSKAVKYGIALLGIPEEKWGDDLSKQVMLNFIRNAYPAVSVEEIRLAFDLALEGKTGANLELYKGEIVSAKFVGNIILCYQKFKVKSIPKPKEDQMNCQQRADLILNLLGPELKEKLLADRGARGVEVKPKEERKAIPEEEIEAELERVRNANQRNQDKLW